MEGLVHPSPGEPKSTGGDGGGEVRTPSTKGIPKERFAEQPEI